MTAPALLVAARRKFLDSEQYADLDAAGLIGTWQTPAQPWVFVESDARTGLPSAYGSGRAAVVFSLRPAQWTSAINSARHPEIGVTVWAQAPDGANSYQLSTTEWLARAVGESVTDCFDDPAGEHPHQWTPDVYVAKCRWNGTLTAFEAEGIPGLFRAELGFEIETV